MTLLEAAENALSALEFMRDDPDIIGWCLEADEAILALHKALQTIDHNLVAAAEREACAKVCEELAALNRSSPTDSMWQWGECAAAIRARGQK